MARRKRRGNKPPRLRAHGSSVCGRHPWRALHGEARPKTAPLKAKPLRSGACVWANRPSRARHSRINDVLAAGLLYTGTVIPLVFVPCGLVCCANGAALQLLRHRRSSGRQLRQRLTTSGSLATPGCSSTTWRSARRIRTCSDLSKDLSVQDQHLNAAICLASVSRSVGRYRQVFAQSAAREAARLDIEIVDQKLFYCFSAPL